MASAFKFFDTPGVPITGEYATSPYGTEAYGGSGVPGFFEIPAPEVTDSGGESDSPAHEHHVVHAAVEHRRHGALIGHRVWKEIRRWQFQYFGTLSADEIAAFKQFFDVRRFKLIPDTQNEESYVPVFWAGPFRARPMRGGTYSLGFELEEVP